MDQSDSPDAALSFRNAEAAAARGDFKAAFRDSLMALALDPSLDRHRQLALNYLRVAAGYRSLPDAVQRALEQCALDDGLDLQPLAMVVRETLGRDKRLEQVEHILKSGARATEAAIESGELSWFLSHKLLLAVLVRAINIDVRIEDILTSLRRHTALWYGETSKLGALPENYPDFVAALAVQAHHAGFPWAEVRTERDILSRAAIDPAAAVLTVMYRPVENLHPAHAALLPGALVTLSEMRTRLAQAARNLPTITTIDDDTSRRIANQYEQYPYPPWDAPSRSRAADPIWASALLDAEHRPDGFPTVTEKPLQILIAGCGTGLGAVETALAAPRAEIIGFDLSRTSLAYAAEKAARFAPGRITFGVGDILNLDTRSDGRWFDLIECSGVLHHMADPALGLAALARALRPGGLMKIALYSERGRSAVIAARKWIEALGWRGVPAGVRGARKALLALPHDHPARPVTEMIDFFSLDATHDLLFNAVEHRYSPMGIGEMLKSAGLEFVQFEVPMMLANHSALPRGNDAGKFAAWETFEKAHPSAFTEMFQFWCRKPL